MSKVILRWVDRLGVEPDSPADVVAHVRITRRGFLRWEYEVWWTAPHRALVNHRVTTINVPIRFVTRGAAPTAFQCVALAGRFVARRSPKGSPR